MSDLRVMFGLSDLNEPIMEPRSEEDFSICRADASPGQKYVLKFTPPSESRFYSQGKYSSPGVSKSVPRQKSNGFRTKINRSLNFDIGKKTHHKAPSSNFSLNNQCHLSRSAKILKSLNIDINPMKINKTLKFDTTPSPKKLSISSQSRCNISNLSLDSPSIIKTLHYDSPSESSEASPMNTSVGSIDENQNQTPSSQKNKKAKKSLSYSSPSSNGRSPDFGVLSPGLRTELREKIDDIVQVSMTPKLLTFKNDKDESVVVSTPRNLLDDYSDDEDDDSKEEEKNKIDEKEENEEEEENPETPKNTIRVVPEGMSAIKKSHRKERVAGRLMKLENFEKSLTMDIEDDKERPLDTSQFTIESIKKSHKKDKNKRKSCNHHSDDELSETGSLFDYSAPEILQDSGLYEEDDKNIINNNEIPKIVIDYVSPLTSKPEKNIIENKNSSEANTSNNSSTPENKIDYLRHVIMTDSIKKSHKKVKVINKKTLFKSRVLDKGLDDEIENIAVQKDNDKSQNLSKNEDSRSGTPENTNSSRLLLERFSSVKKSHRKDKHRVLGFSQRQINMKTPKNNDEKTSLIDENNALKNCENEASTSKTMESRWQYKNLGTCPLDDNEPSSLGSTPNKRKSPSNKNLQSSSSGTWKIENESADEEFQIFTPIKKKKPLKTSSLSDDNIKLFPEMSMESGRCETPKLSQETEEDNFKTPIKIKNTSLIKKNNNDNNNSGIVVDEQQQIEDVNGRSTPENQVFPHITGLSSIKKSHKKDKLTKSTKRTSYLLKKFVDVKEIVVNSPMKEKKLQTNWRSVGGNDSSSSDCMEKSESDNQSSPQASTSYSGLVETNSPVKTPPNTLGTKTYLRLIQTTSIKRSHKKMRDQKKQESIILEPDLSDDGSLFDESEKRLDSSLDNSDCMPLDGDNDQLIENNFVEKINSKRRCQSGNKSDDGSIFGSDCELPKSPRKRNVKIVKNNTSKD